MSPAGPSLRGSGSQLLVSRVVEQGVLGLGALYLARELGVSGFVPISVLLVVNSVGVTLSDFGVGLHVLRLETGHDVHGSLVQRVRVVNSAIVVGAVAVGFGADGDAKTVIWISGLIWASSSEAFIRKAGAIRRGSGALAARAEIVSSVVLAVALLVAPTTSDATLVVGLGLAAKHVVEAVMIRLPAGDIDATVKLHRLWSIWFAQVLAFMIANVDFILIGAFFGEEEFAVYVLAFRLANALPSQIAHVAGKTGSAALAASVADDRQVVYERYLSRLFTLGLAGMAALLAVSPILPVVLGDEWDELSVLTALLALSVAFRMIIGIAGTVTIVARRAERLVRWEIVHLVLLSAVLLAVAQGDVRVFALTLGAATAVAAFSYHRAATRVAGLDLPGWLRPATAAALVVYLGLGAILQL